MAENKKNTTPKKPKFNPYWIYGGIILALIAVQFLGSNNFSESAKISPSQFFEYLRNGDIDKVDIVNKREAKVYLSKEAESKSVHEKSISKPFPFFYR